MNGVIICGLLAIGMLLAIGGGDFLAWIERREERKRR